MEFKAYTPQKLALRYETPETRNITDFEIGQRLKKYRKAKGCGVHLAALAFGISAGELEFMEVGLTRISPEVIRKAAKLYGVSTNEIIAGKTK